MCCHHEIKKNNKSVSLSTFAQVHSVSSVLEYLLCARHFSKVLHILTHLNIIMIGSITILTS